VLDTLALDNSVARNRTLAYLAQTALRSMEVGELEERIRNLEAGLLTQSARQAPIFDADEREDHASFFDLGMES